MTEAARWLLEWRLLGVGRRPTLDRFLSLVVFLRAPQAVFFLTAGLDELAAKLLGTPAPRRREWAWCPMGSTLGRCAPESSQRFAIQRWMRVSMRSDEPVFVV